MSGVAIASVAISAYSAISSSQNQKKAMKQQAAANAAQQRATSAEAQRERIKAIREARMRAGQIEGAGGTMGMGQASSGIAGSISSIGSQAADNIGRINVQEGFAAQASAANIAAAKYQSKAATWQAIGSISTSIFNQAAPNIFAEAGGKVGIKNSIKDV